MSKYGTAQEMVQDFVRVTQELGRTPSRDEYHGIPDRAAYGRHSIQAVKLTFGGWQQFIQACGVSEHARRGKRDKQELKKAAFDHAIKESEQRKKKIIPPSVARNLILLPDLHAPAMHPQAIDFIKAVVKKYGFDIAACTGDEIDGHAWSFHSHEPDYLSPGYELNAAIKQLKPLYEMFPKMLLAESNHGSLISRKARHHGLPTNVIKPYGEVIEAPTGWEWHFEIKLQLSNGKRLLIHHSYSANALRASQHRGVNYCAGHHHSQFSIQYWRNYDDLFFAAFAGSLVDETSLAMLYGKNTMHRPILGLLRIEDGIPYLIPMITDAGGVWTGKI